MKAITRLSLIAVVFFVLVGNSKAEETTVIAPIGADGVQRVEIVGASYFFKPNHVVVKVNVPVEVNIRKEGGMTPHSFVLKNPEAGIDVDVDLGKEPKTVRFTPTKVGKYAFYCDKKLLFFKSHRENGMTGVLEVRE